MALCRGKLEQGKIFPEIFTQWTYLAGRKTHTFIPCFSVSVVMGEIENPELSVTLVCKEGKGDTAG